MGANVEWVVLVEATDEGGGSTIEIQDVERLVDILDDSTISALYHPQRYAIQVNIDAPTAAEAVAVVLARCTKAAQLAGLPRWDLARVEVLSTEEFARELETDERPLALTTLAGTADGMAAAFAENLLARAFRDSLTGLPTIELFRDRMAAVLGAGHGSAVDHHLLVIDLDAFAEVNRRLGYAAGDQVLTVMADRLGQTAGAEAEVARIGGDEFAVLLRDQDADTAERLAIRILDVVSAPVNLAQGDVSVSASLGVAAGGRDVDGLLRNASVAMCAAKHAGGSGHKWFVPGLAVDLSRLEFDVDPAPDRLSCVLLVERAAMAANEEACLARAAQIVLQQVCAHAGWVAGRFVASTDEDSAEAQSAWHSTMPKRYRRLQEALDARGPQDTGNLLTRVQADGEAAWLTDLAARSSVWAREAALAGIRATYCFPICVGREVVGTLEFFSTRAVKPDGSLLDVMKSVGLQLGRVAERRRGQAALARSAEKYRAMAEGVPVLMWMSDTTGKVNFLNRQWLAFRGRALDEELGDGWADGVHADDLDRCLDTYTTAFERRESFEMTFRLRRADGEYRQMLGRGSPIGTEFFQGYVGGCIDVTERHDATRDLRRSDARFRALIDNMGSVTVVIGGGGTVLEEHLGTISLGYSDHHSVGRIGFEYIHPDDQGRAAEEFVDVLRGPGVHAPFEMRVAAADGSWRVMEAVSNNQLDNPDIGGIVVTSVDLTDRKRRELALAESERHLREALALAQVGTWRHDLATGDDACSEELCRLLGRGPATSVVTGSLELWEAIHIGDRALFRAAIDELRASGDVREGVFRVVRTDGELRMFHGRMTAMGVDGEITAVLATFQDVTDGSPPHPEPTAPERWASPAVARSDDPRPSPTAACLGRHFRGEGLTSPPTVTVPSRRSPTGPAREDRQA